MHGPQIPLEELPPQPQPGLPPPGCSQPHLGPDTLWPQVMDQKLSGQRAALERGQNPLPLYLSLNVKENNLETLDFKEWVEFSPYEVGFLKYGAFIPPELFGSEFFMGRLMKRTPEPRICFLEAIWSNIFSLNLLDAWYDLTSSGEAWTRHVKEKTRSLGGKWELRGLG
ncbi:Cytosolic phospholipase A2 delta [Saguinus oedipus]|uniref:Cytosolic phospholipase A2 delta n=1 Tax=Saguinus oedipus TaxID=9490 RepID=A0ABQ9V2Y4_SAGOE|nr:Cytosolic phospholipase A2 delta [Saguinus oedipus]